jgi:hypothetical protein
MTLLGSIESVHMMNMSWLSLAEPTMMNCLRVDKKNQADDLERR